MVFPVQPGGGPFRFLGWTYLFLLAEFLILRGRIYYLAPDLSNAFCRRGGRHRGLDRKTGKNWIKNAILAPLVVGGMVAAPLALPILPLDAAAAYANFWDVERSAAWK